MAFLCSVGKGQALTTKSWDQLGPQRFTDMSVVLAELRSKKLKSVIFC
jgi:hypothetical protein